MQISFGKIIPTVVYLNGKPVADKDIIDKITTNAARDLRNDAKNCDDNDVKEIMRQYFQARVADYKIPLRRSQNGEPRQSNVTTANIEDGRYLVTGNDIDELKKAGQNFYNNQDDMSKKDAGRVMQEELKYVRRVGLSRPLCINAQYNPEKKTDKEKYPISCIYFKP